MEFERHIIKTAEEAATTFRAMAVCGPRQVGKTWLLKRLAAKLGGYETVSLDDEALLVQARNDPKLFLDLHPAPLVIDEIQSAPELFSALKMRLDASYARGQYLMTGSQQFKMMKGAKESLAGRVGILRLAGLSKAEIEANPQLRAVLEDFDFQIPAPKVASFEFSTSANPLPQQGRGSRLDPSMLSSIKGLKRGQKFYIDNVKVTTPDGVSHSLTLTLRMK